MRPFSSMRGVPWLMVLVYLTAVSCANSDEPRAAVAATASPRPGPSEAPLVVFLGDSLTAGYGLAQDEAFPALVGGLLAEAGTPIRVVNAGVSGDTTAGGVERVDWVLRQRPRVLVVGLGANDALRGLPADAIEANLREIVTRGKGAGARVLLLGMKLPPSYGGYFTKGFEEIFPRLARELEVPFVPFLLEGVGGHADLNLDDGIHPNAEGQKIVARSVAPYVERIVKDLR